LSRGEFNALLIQRKTLILYFSHKKQAHNKKIIMAQVKSLYIKAEHLIIFYFYF